MNTILKCTIKKGMFSDERVVEIEIVGGDVVSFFVPSGFVDEERGGVRVMIIRGGIGDSPRAVIPTQRRPAIPVNESDLLPA